MVSIVCYQLSMTDVNSESVVQQIDRKRDSVGLSVGIPFGTTSATQRQDSDCELSSILSICLNRKTLTITPSTTKQIDCSTGVQWTGKELHDCTLSVSDAFINVFDLNPGDSVCIWCANSDVHAIAFMATVSAGANYVPIDLNYTYGKVNSGSGIVLKGMFSYNVIFLLNLSYYQRTNLT